MIPKHLSRAALDKLERDMKDQSGPLVTEQQLQRILSINSLSDPAERVARLNEIHEDLQRQVVEIEARWRMLEGQLSRISTKLPADQQKMLDELNAEVIAGIRAEAASLLSRDTLPPAPTLSVSRRLRMTI